MQATIERTLENTLQALHAFMDDPRPENEAWCEELKLRLAEVTALSLAVPGRPRLVETRPAKPEEWWAMVA